jgi:hypothetical protein
MCLLSIEPDDNGVPRIAGRLIFACNHEAAYPLASWLIESNAGPATVIGAGEAFVAGRGAGARQTGAAVTRQVIADLSSLPIAWQWRTASEVKTWATDVRLKASALYDMTVKSIDARDAARIALFCAVADAGLPDPLSKRRQ